ncbi:MAG: patatin-like phospholipase family protein [Sandaracinaceae bacterium]|nr:patatin-like phospholipase family protein [Sandaracinaceae bacterium]
MSSGFFGFFAHTGMLMVLEEEGLLPARVTGSSAGALIGGLWASGISASDLGEELVRLSREDFWDPTPGFGLLRGKRFREKLGSLLQKSEMKDTRVPVSISVFDVLTNKTRALSEGSMAAAIHASCAVPFLFHPVWIGGRPYLDGGITDRPGLHSVRGDERVFYHHLSSRSPWRKRGSKSLDVPQREGLTALVIDHLPRVGPFKLEIGKHALEEARRVTKRALSAEVHHGLVRF